VLLQRTLLFYNSALLFCVVHNSVCTAAWFPLTHLNYIDFWDLDIRHVQFHCNDRNSLSSLYLLSWHTIFLSCQQAVPKGMLDDWQENLAILTANRTKDDDLVITHLGDCLWKEKNEVWIFCVEYALFLFFLEHAGELYIIVLRRFKRACAQYKHLFIDYVQFTVITVRFNAGCVCSLLLPSCWTKYWFIFWKCKDVSHWRWPLAMSTYIFQPRSYPGISSTSLSCIMFFLLPAFLFPWHCEIWV
jgi:hypothetical protein